MKSKKFLSKLKLKTAFPNLTDWEYSNEENEDYYGFAVWGKFILNPEELMYQTFFVTIGIYQDKWQGSLLEFRLRHSKPAQPYSISQHEIALLGKRGIICLNCHTALSMEVSQLVIRSCLKDKSGFLTTFSKSYKI